MLDVLKKKKASKVADGFEALHERLAPAYSEPDGAEKNLHAIERCLSQDFGMSYMAPYGSTSHGTNVDGESATDCFAVIPKGRLIEQSGKALESLFAALEPHFPEAFLIDGRPAIAVPFGPQKSDRHHVVAAFAMESEGEHDVFGIPGPSERWIEACPGGHSAWINRLDRAHGQRFKPLVRMIKSWNYGEGEPIWSFYLEHAVADYLATRDSGQYASDMQGIFTYLLESRLAPFKKSEGSNEPVYATSLADKFEAMGPLRSALEKVKKARFCERHGNLPDAYFWWRKLFHYQFPAY